MKFSQKRNVKETASTVIKSRLMKGKDLNLWDRQCHLKAKYYDNLNYVLWEHSINTTCLKRIQYCTNNCCELDCNACQSDIIRLENITVQLQRKYFRIVFLLHSIATSSCPLVERLRLHVANSLRVSIVFWFALFLKFVYVP